MNSNRLEQPEARLSEQEVRQRLVLCTDTKVIDELYTFGQTLYRDSLEQIKTAETKATSFAGYGTAVATLLVSSSATWVKLGNSCSLWVAFFSCLSALACTYFAVQALQLRSFKVISDNDWLNEGVLSDVNKLKGFRILSLWALISSRADGQRAKARAVARVQVWLAGAVTYLVILILQIALTGLYRGWIVRTLNVHQGQCWQMSARWIGLLSLWGAGGLCVLVLGALIRRSRRT